MEEDLGLYYSRHYVVHFLEDSRIFRDQDPERMVNQFINGTKYIMFRYNIAHKHNQLNFFEDIPRNLYGSYKVVDCNFRNISDRSKMIRSIPYPWDIFHHLLQFHILGATQ